MLVLFLLAVSTVAALSVCVIVRTYPAQKAKLPILLLSLNEAAVSGKVKLYNFILDTEPKPDTTYLQLGILTAQVHFPGSYYEHVILKDFNPTTLTRGYEDTDVFLKLLLNSTRSEHKSCEYFLITDGDNAYTTHLFTTLRPRFNAKIDFIAFNFVNRRKVLETEFKLKGIDMGSVFMSRRCLLEARLVFLAQGYASPNMYSRDWFFFEMILKSPRNYTRSINREIVFLHL
jgi:hypothetical protein